MARDAHSSGDGASPAPVTSDGNGARPATGKPAPEPGHRTVHRRRSDDAPRRPTLRDVAGIAKVDISLVSRVVNRDASLSILPATRARIEAAIQQTGYFPNVQARGLRTQRTFTIGFLLPETWGPVYDPIVIAAMRRAAEQGYLIVIGSSLEAQFSDRPFERLLLERRVDGLMVASGELSDSGLGAANPGGAPILFVNRRVPGAIGSAVVDDAAGAALATNHLVELGHRRLAHLGGPTGVDTASRRREGFLDAASRAGLSATVVEIAGYDAEGGRLAMARILERDSAMTGIVAANMNVAIGAVRAVAEAGLGVPRDVSIVAIHDHPLAAYLSPALTCVRLPLADLGRAAVDMLLARVGGEPLSDVMVTGEVELVRRESTAPPAAKPG
jgi:LacI family transcriptional regulator